MRWKKLGLILRPKDYKLKWWDSFGMDPTVFRLKDSIYRIFFCGRNKINQSLIGYADINLDLTTKILNTYHESVICFNRGCTECMV